MNEQYTTMNLPPMMRAGHSRDDISSADINSLLKGRSFGKKQEDAPFNIKPQVQEYSDEEMKELEEFCKKRGIIGLNFNGMNPRAILNMLKGKTSDRSSINETKRGLLNG